MTQADAAKGLHGWTQTAISKIERGERELKAVELWEFAQLYGKSIDDFFVDEDESKKK